MESSTATAAPTLMPGTAIHLAEKAPFTGVELRLGWRPSAPLAQTICNHVMGHDFDDLDLSCFIGGEGIVEHIVTSKHSSTRTVHHSGDNTTGRNFSWRHPLGGKPQPAHESIIVDMLGQDRTKQLVITITSPTGRDINTFAGLQLEVYGRFGPELESAIKLNEIDLSDHGADANSAMIVSQLGYTNRWNLLALHAAGLGRSPQHLTSDPQEENNSGAPSVLPFLY